MKLLLCFVTGFISLLCLFTSTLSMAVQVPLVEKNFFWFETDDGRVVPAFLHERSSEVPTPGSIEEDDVTYWHYLPGQEQGRQIRTDCSDNCLSDFAQGAPLFLGAHGYGAGHIGGLGNSIRAGFKERGEPINIVLINWSKLSPVPNYYAAVLNTQPAGEHIARLINYLVDQGVASLNETYYAGHSLGGHIPNYINPNLNGGKMRAVFALDPASPFFDIRKDDARLDPEDAQFVNVIHTSIMFIGFRNPAGHVDFYPNSGKEQPGCDDNAFQECSHNIVIDFFKESIVNPEAFSSCKCNSWGEFDDGSCTCEERTPMGWGTSLTATGVYYLRTNPESPYSQN